jgi:hypothetical protein
VIPLSTLLAATTPRPASTQFAAGHAHWLARCQGFRALSEDGGIGVIERVGYASSPPRAAFLLVRRGILGSSLVLVEADDVLEIDPRRRTVHLRPGYRETAVAPAPGVMSRLLHQLIAPSLPSRS